MRSCLRAYSGGRRWGVFAIASSSPVSSPVSEDHPELFLTSPPRPLKGGRVVRKCEEGLKFLTHLTFPHLQLHR
jgi:hypothetical protein